MESLYISDFNSVEPRYSLTQDQSVKNMVEIRYLINQKRAALGLDKSIEKKRIEARVQRFGLANSKIKLRRSELKDYTLDIPAQEAELTFFNAVHPPNLDTRMSIYSERVQEVFNIFYPTPENIPCTYPDHLIHVSCTGYSAPSPAQRVTAQWDFSQQPEGKGMTTVTHAYHMGCYASLPALRIARGFITDGLNNRHRNLPVVDIVHNELCSLHVNPLNFDPEQMVVQSLFADGHVKYSMTSHKPPLGLAVENLLEEVIPNTTELMLWTPSSTHFQISLSRDVPNLFNVHLKPYLAHLFKKANLTPDSSIIYAIHPGGPKIIETVENVLELSQEQTQESHDILTYRGNMSSATLPHIWDAILKNPKRKNGSVVVSLAFGPGITISGGVFRICRS